MTHLISVRVSNEMLEESRRLKINYTQVVRAALEEEIRKRKDMELAESISKIHNLLSGVDIKQLIAEIRKNRDER